MFVAVVVVVVDAIVANVFINITIIDINPRIIAITVITVFINPFS